MADKTHISWTQATWNVITGCSLASPGCTNCYAMRLAGTRLADHRSRSGLTHEVNGNPVWTGEVRFNVAWLRQPLDWHRPRTIFVCAHGDLFHEHVPTGWIDTVFAIIALAPQHVYQVLTKRAGRMRDYLNDPETPIRVAARLLELGTDWGLPGDALLSVLAIRQTEDEPERVAWPLRQVWAGVSVEDQRRAEERLPALTVSNAAVRWVSAEPLLGPLDLGDFLFRLDWLVAGAESGPNARPMDENWVRALRDQCATAGTAFYYKQKVVGRKKIELPPLDGRVWNQFPGGPHV